jgi:heptosyltransferase-3
VVVFFLRERGFSGILATGEAEERWEEELRKVALPAGWTWLRRPALPALARSLREAALYLGNDSGVTHLAAACGTNVIAIFRKEFETAWRPFGRTTVLSAEDVERVSLEDVVAAIGRVLK